MEAVMARQLQISALIFSLLFSSFGLAEDSRHFLFDSLESDVAQFESACPGDVCQNPYSQRLVYDSQGSINELPLQLQRRLGRIANEQAQLWGDTILESDYYADGSARLDSVLALYRDNQLIAYRIEYSERAWNTADCSFDGSEASLNQCQEGRIAESSYVSPEGRVFINNQHGYAQFYN